MRLAECSDSCKLGEVPSFLISNFKFGFLTEVPSSSFIKEFRSPDVQLTQNTYVLSTSPLLRPRKSSAWFKVLSYIKCAPKIGFCCCNQFPSDVYIRIIRGTSQPTQDQQECGRNCHCQVQDCIQEDVNSTSSNRTTLGEPPWFRNCVGNSI
jgi:hypothetical protein